MKKILILLYMLVNCATSVAQFTQIQTNTTDPLGRIEHIGDTWIVQGWNNYFLKSSNLFDTYTLLNMPSNPNYKNVIHEASGNLYLVTSDLGPEYTAFYESKDTGNTWQFKFDILGFYGDEYIMFDTLNGIMIDVYNYSLITKDGGNTWQFQNIIGSTFGTAKYNDSIGLWTSVEKVMLTYDQFSTTIVSNCSDLLNPLRAIYLSPDTILITSLSQGNYFVYTTDSAQSWHSVETSPFSGRGMYFFNGHEGYVVGRDYAAGQGAVYKTTDMGQTWIKYYTGIDCILQDIAFMNDSIALITGTNGVLLKWNKHSAPTGVEDVASRNDKAFKIYPNPAYKKDITIDFYTSKSEIVYVSIIDVQGNQVAKQQFNSCTQCINKFNMDIHSLSNGTYTIMILSEGKTSVQKIFIAK